MPAIASARKRLLSGSGFTLIELMLVVVILGILTGFAAPELLGIIPETELNIQRTNAAEIRSAIDKYYADRGAYPKNLTDLTDSTHPYFRILPVDPVTKIADWEVQDRKTKKWFRTSKASYRNAPPVWNASAGELGIFDVRPRPY